MTAECRFCFQMPELYFGQWVPHKPGQCPFAVPEEEGGWA